MKKIKRLIVLIVGLMLGFTTFAQHAPSQPWSMPILRQLLYPSPFFQLKEPAFTAHAAVYPSLNNRSLPMEMRQRLQTSYWTAPRAYQFTDLAFFCKVEVQLEKSVGFPVKFRLGDLNYVNYLEGKNP